MLPWNASDALCGGRPSKSGLCEDGAEVWHCALVVRSGTTCGWGLLQLPCHICQHLLLFYGIVDLLLCQMSMAINCGWLTSISPDGPEVST